MKNAAFKKSSTNPNGHGRDSAKDAVRVLIALVCILFASLATVDHETPADHHAAQALAQEQQDQQDQQIRRTRAHDMKRAAKLPEAPLFQRINGSI